MNHDVNIADFVVHLHPGSSPDEREIVEKELRALNGVVSVHFDQENQPHAVVVAYNPDAITSEAVLAQIRKHDEAAVMAGL
jgi:hypothetical protein